MKESVEEMLIKFIQSKLRSLLKDYEKEKDPETCDDICQALELCDKLLTNDYFYESEQVIEDFLIDKSKMKFMNCRNNWQSQYTLDLREKKTDLKKLFSIIVNNIEDWC